MAQPTYVPLPTNVSFGTVTGRFLTAVADSPNDVDRDPEGVAATDLSIRFTPSITPAVVRDQSATPPVIFALSPVVATVGPTGDLLGPDGQPGVRLVASGDPDLDPTGWPWTVTLTSPTFPAVSFSFVLDPGQSVDLATVVQVPAGPGATLAAWLQAVTDARAARDEAVAAVGSAGSTFATKVEALTAGLTLMGLGDSITYNGGNNLPNKFQTVGDFYFTDKSWHLYAQMLSGGRFQHMANGALGGYTIEQVRDTWLPAVLAARPALCTVLAGQNNLGSLTAANLAALGDIYDQLVAAGIVPVLCTNPATSTSTDLFRLNAWVRRQSRERGLPLADLYAATVDPATGAYRSGYSTDGTHPVAAGALAMGQALADTLAPYLRAGSPDLAQSEGGYYGLVPGPLFLTDNGATPPSPIAGWTPLTTYQPGDFAYSANPAGPGRRFTIARRAGGVDNKIRVPLGAPTEGDVLRWATRIDVTVPTGGSVTLDFQDGQSTSVLGVTFTRSVSGVINLERPARVSAPHYLDVTAGGVDGAQVSFAQFTVQNLSALAAA